jgi:hypothetical protein
MRHSILKHCDIGDQNIDRRPINMWNIEQKPQCLYLQYKFVLQEEVTQKIHHAPIRKQWMEYE